MGDKLHESNGGIVFSIRYASLINSYLTNVVLISFVFAYAKHKLLHVANDRNMHMISLHKCPKSICSENERLTCQYATRMS